MLADQVELVTDQIRVENRSSANQLVLVERGDMTPELFNLVRDGSSDFSLS